MLHLALVLGLASLAPQDVDEKSSPFDGLRWSGDQPEVQVEDSWYEPVAIDGIAVEEILSLADTWSPGREKRFAEDLVPLLQRLKWDGDAKVDLDLRALEDGATVRLEGVEMTRAKRTALRSSRRVSEPGGASRPSAPTSISRGDARADIEAFGAGLKDQFAYLGLGEVDLDRELSQIGDGLSGGEVDILELRLELHRLLMRFGDGHAQVRSNLPLGQRGDKYLPFLLVEAEGGVVAVLPDRSALVEPAAPFVRSIDGKTMGEWIELARPYVANGSPQLVRRRALGDMREIDWVRRVLGEETGAPLKVTFSTADGGETVERELELSSRRPTYGDWPRSGSKLLDGDIGYLRIAKMDGDVDSLHEAMEEFVDTEGLIVDVRGNGGGTRELLLALGGYLIGPKEPAVVGNVAQYRLSERFDEGHLEARYMHRADWSGWSDRQREAIEAAAATFKPEWQPVGEFSEWHYLVMDRTGHPAEYFYDLPVVVLSDAGCFSATDIFLGALELLPRVTLLGTASSGGSARSQSFRLPKTGLEVRCASMASFRPDGRLYDGRGVEVDVEVAPAPGDFLRAGGDAQLEAALARFGVVVSLGEEGGDSNAGRALVEALATSLAADDYEAFKSVTCLGMKKAEFEEFMRENPNRKVLGVWDSAEGDFRAALKADVREVFEQARKGEMDPRVRRGGEGVFDWSRAEVRLLDWERGDGGDVKATLVSGELGAFIKIDDCFMTPKGLLAFDVPLGMIMPADKLPEDF